MTFPLVTMIAEQQAQLMILVQRIPVERLPLAAKLEINKVYTFTVREEENSPLMLMVASISLQLRRLRQWIQIDGACSRAQILTLMTGKMNAVKVLHQGPPLGLLLVLPHPPLLLLLRDPHLVP